jgi:hypothetical protein
MLLAFLLLAFVPDSFLQAMYNLPLFSSRLNLVLLFLLPFLAPPLRHLQIESTTDKDSEGGAFIVTPFVTFFELLDHCKVRARAGDIVDNNGNGLPLWFSGSGADRLVVGAVEVQVEQLLATGG